MRILDSNIYMYGRGKYTKSPPEEYNNKKDYFTSNTYHLILLDISDIIAAQINSMQFRS
jgi:hypothetical protein